MEDGNNNGLVLSGGGSFAAYEVGVTHALVRGQSMGTGYRPLEPSIYAGTSSGAFNAAFLASRWELPAAAAAAELVQAWRERIADQGAGAGNGVFRFRANPLELFDPRILSRHPLRTLERLIEDGAVLTWEALTRAAAVLTRDRPLYHRFLELFDLSAIISTRPLRKTLHETIDFGRLRRSNRALRITATNWKTGDLVLFDHRDMSDELGPDLIRGSASVPGLFPPQPVGTWELVDGGVVMNTPLKPAIRAGAQVLHLIHVFPDPENIPLSLLGSRSTVGALSRAQLASWATVLDSDFRYAVSLNDRLKMFHRMSGHLEENLPSPQQVSRVRELAGRLEQEFPVAKYNYLTIHRYQPREPLGLPPLAVLDFGHRQIEDLIARGHRDAVAHDCRLDGCILPEVGDGDPPGEQPSRGKKE